MKTALLLSGGIDSISLLYMHRPDLAVTIDYGQKPFLGELRASQQAARVLDIPHHIIKSDISKIGSGDLSGIEALEISPSKEWWPYRNQYLITVAAMKLLGDGVQKILCGSVKNDGFHTDGTKQFYELINSLLKFQEGGMIVEAPAIDLTSVDLVKMSNVPNSIISWAHSCHKAEFACEDCRGCAKYHSVMYSLGLIDQDL